MIIKKMDSKQEEIAELTALLIQLRIVDCGMLRMSGSGLAITR